MGIQEPAVTLARQIADRIHAPRIEDISPVARSWVRSAFIDTVGCTLAGMAEPAPHILLRVPGVAESSGPALIFATNRRTSVLDATLVNGTASHALDYDDVAGTLGGHPSAMLVPPLIALGESLGSSGSDLMLAYVVGFETMCRIARGVHFHHYDKGWHPTATLGIFGTVAAAARLLRLPADRTAVALSMAASFASGLKANFGTMTKPLHVGHASRNGLFAALMAQQGFVANDGAFEHKQGFLEVFNGAGTYDTTKLLADWYSPVECEGGGDPGLKPYPCCGSTHAAVGLTIELARRHNLSPAQVARIEVMPHLRRLPHTDNPHPSTPLGAKFSVQYCVARALSDRAVTLAHFEGEAHLEPAIRNLMQHVTARPHPDMAADSPLQWGAEVVVTTNDGERLSARVDDYPSRGPGGKPMTQEELWTKFSDCAARVLPSAQLVPLFEKLAGIDSLESVASLTKLMEPAMQRVP
jgi:2-methylcitrate dehydratase PrpD